MFSLQPATRAPGDSLFNVGQTSLQMDVISQTSQARDSQRINQRWFDDRDLLSVHRQDVTYAMASGSVSYDSSCGGVGLSPANVDTESALLRMPARDLYRDSLDAVVASDERSALNPRPVSSVPYMGRGAVNPTLESRIRQGIRPVETASKQSLPDTCAAGSEYQSIGQHLQRANGASVPFLPLGNEAFGPANRYGYGGLYEEHTGGMRPFGVNTEGAGRVRDVVVNRDLVR